MILWKGQVYKTPKFRISKYEILNMVQNEFSLTELKSISFILNETIKRIVRKKVEKEGSRVKKNGIFKLFSEGCPIWFEFKNLLVKILAFTLFCPPVRSNVFFH